MKFLRNTILALSFATHGALYAQDIQEVQDTTFVHIASCNRLMTGVPTAVTLVALDFFEEYEVISGKTTNKGYVWHTIEFSSGENEKRMGKIALAGTKQRIITMDSADTSFPFATFTIDFRKETKTDIEIHFDGLSSVFWGKFSCNPTQYAGILYGYRVVY